MTDQTINDQMYFTSKMAGYKISNKRAKAGDSDITYYGYVDRRGNWYIMKVDKSDGVAGNTTYEFIKGASLYSTNWTTRESLVYASFDSTFA